MDHDPFSAWTNQLLNYQRQYRDALEAFAAKSDPAEMDGASVDGANPWVAALEQWWKTIEPSTLPPVRDFCSRLVDQGRNYFQMTGGLNGVFERASVAGDSAAQWQQAVNDTLTGLKAIFAGRKSDMQGAARQAIAFWELPLNMWRRAVSSLSVLPGDFLRNVSAMSVEQVRDELHGRVDQLLSTPAIGYMREDQEQIQTLIKLNIDYQQALQDYAATYNEIGVKCVEAFQQRLQSRAAEENPVESLREIYDLWVDSCEQAYGEYVCTDEYVAIYGRLVNSLMAVKRHGTRMVDEALGALNMPTRGEIDTLHRRLQEVRREEKALRTEIEWLKDGWQGEVRQPASSASASAPTSEPAAPKRKVAAKQAPRSVTKKKSRASRSRSSQGRS